MSSPATPPEPSVGRRGVLSGWMQNRRRSVAAAHLVGPLLDVGCGARAVLAHDFAPSDYVGVEIADAGRAAAARAHPQHRFVAPGELGEDEQFATAAALAVIEHVDDPQGFVDEMVDHVRPGGSVVITTPAPAAERFHELGGKFGLFSRNAHHQHEDLLDEAALREVFTGAGLDVIVYKKFMFGLNQLMVGRVPDAA